jgi:hypothetical protein
VNRGKYRLLKLLVASVVWRIQEMVDEAPEATKYCSGGYLGYLDVGYYVAAAASIAVWKPWGL